MCTDESNLCAQMSPLPFSGSILVSGSVSSKIPQQNFDSLQEVERERMKELTGRYCKPCHLHLYETLFVGKE